MKLAWEELWLCLRTASIMEWKSLQLSDTLLRFQFGASLFSSATQAQLARLTQLAASHSDQGARVNDIRV